MSDICLKRITISSGGTFSFSDNGVVQITDTTSSVNRLTGSLLVNGGIGISSTYNSVSSTNGGSLTLGGGIGVSKSAFIGGDLELDSTISKLRVKGVSVDRFFLDDISSKNMFISVDGLDKQLEIIPESVSILCTSSNSLSVSGGVIVYSSANSTSTTDGALRILGGAGIEKDIYLGQNAYLNGTLQINYSQQQILLNGSVSNSKISNENSDILSFYSNGGIFLQSTNGNIVFRAGGSSTGNITINDSLFQISKNLSVSGTSQFTKETQILSTVNSSSGSSGSLVVSGGLGVIKDIYTDGDLTLNSGIFYLTTSGNVQASGSSLNFYSSDVFNFFDTANTNNNLKIGPYGMITNDSYQIFSTSGSLLIKEKNSGEACNLQLLAVDNDSTDSVSLTIHASTSSSLKLGWDTVNYYILTPSKFVISNSVSNVSLESGTTFFSSTVESNNVTSGSIVSFGGLGISKNTRIGGDLVIKATTITQNTNGDTTLLNNSTGIFRLNGQTYLDSILYTNAFISSGSLFSINNKLFLSTSGNIGILTSAPQSELHVNGNLIVSNGITVSNLLLTNVTVTNQALLNNGAYINGDTLITGSNFITNSQTVSGGSNLYGSTNIYGNLVAGTNSNTTLQNLTVTSNGKINSTIESTSYTNGSLIVSGGLGIAKNTNIGGDIGLIGDFYIYSLSDDQIRFYNNLNFQTFSINSQNITNNFSVSRYNSVGTFVKKSLEINHSTGTLTINEPLISQNTFTTNDTFTANSQSNFMSDVHIYSTTHSSNSSTGALIVDGGVGIEGYLNVLGDAYFNGNITISGTTNSFYSTNTLISDNVISINSGPSGTFNSGIVVERYQTSNDTGTGDVVSDSRYTLFTLPSQSGMGNSEIKLPGSGSIVNDYYTGWWIKVTSGFSVNQVRKVTGYDGTTKIITIESAWTTQNPSLGDTVRLYNRPFVGFLWDETLDIFKFGSTVQDPEDSNIDFLQLEKLEVDSLCINSTSSNSVNVTGGILINNTLNSSIYTNGGITIERDLIVNGVSITPNTEDIFTTTLFNGSNNISSDPIIDFSTSGIWGFDIYISIRLVASQNLYSNYHLRGVRKESTWDLIQSYVGDSIVAFDLSNSGVFSYTCPNYPGFVSLQFKYKVSTN